MGDKDYLASRDQLSTEALKELLQTDINSVEDNNDDFILSILEVIENREKEHPTGVLRDVDQAWSEFQENYNTLEGEELSIYPNSNSLDTGTMKRNSSHKLFSKLAALAAVVIIAFTGIITVQAIGYDIFGAIAQWTANAFHFESAANSESQESLTPQNQEHYNVLKSALSDCGMEASFAPTWYPEGFKMSKPEFLYNDIKKKVYCFFSNEDGQYFGIEIQYFTSTSDISAQLFEKDDLPVEQYFNGRQTFYLMSNLDTTTAIWSDGHYHICIYGNITDENLKQIIESIGGKEK